MATDHQAILDEQKAREQAAKAQMKEYKAEERAIRRASRAEIRKDNAQTRKAKAAVLQERKADQGRIRAFAAEQEYTGKMILFNDRPRMRELPEMMYVHHPTDKRPVIVKYGEQGFWETGPGYNMQSVEQLNENFDIPYSKELEGVMLAGSMFGWNIPKVTDYVMGKPAFRSIKKLKNTRPVCSSCRPKKVVNKAARPNLQKEIWEGWRVIDFIEELQPQLDMIMSGRSWRKPFKTKAEMNEWIKDNQPYIKKSIKDVNDYFAERYGF